MGVRLAEIIDSFAALPSQTSAVRLINISPQTEATLTIQVSIHEQWKVGRRTNPGKVSHHLTKKLKPGRDGQRYEAFVVSLERWAERHGHRIPQCLSFSGAFPSHPDLIALHSSRNEREHSHSHQEEIHSHTTAAHASKSRNTLNYS
ncbi:hypothetical protein DdX_12670 [Ditylenchus destructor]|uniref:Uncharacterized protein n=1 Tax=Ditylenchus destructor TaxID=166010 RepID=A0AAD4MYI7_9BILA|nr:hypothetical protein DdX_12670 [Ditylenchus destructor]